METWKLRAKLALIGAATLLAMVLWLPLAASWTAFAVLEAGSRTLMDGLEELMDHLIRDLGDPIAEEIARREEGR